MPGKDGTGPMGQGPLSRGGARGRGGRYGTGAGPSGWCICPNCSEKAPHSAGTPCSSVLCPKCGTPMIRSM